VTRLLVSAVSLLGRRSSRTLALLPSSAPAQEARGSGWHGPILFAKAGLCLGTDGGGRNAPRLRPTATRIFNDEAVVGPLGGGDLTGNIRPSAWQEGSRETLLPEILGRFGGPRPSGAGSRPGLYAPMRSPGPGLALAELEPGPSPGRTIRVRQPRPRPWRASRRRADALESAPANPSLIDNLRAKDEPSALVMSKHPALFPTARRRRSDRAGHPVAHRGQPASGLFGPSGCRPQAGWASPLRQPGDRPCPAIFHAPRRNGGPCRFLPCHNPPAAAHRTPGPPAEPRPPTALGDIMPREPAPASAATGVQLMAGPIPDRPTHLRRTPLHCPDPGGDVVAPLA